MKNLSLLKNIISLSLALLFVSAIAACDSDNGGLVPNELPFISGTVEDPQIGLVTNSTGNVISLFRLGDPTPLQTIALGASNQITPTGLSVRASRAVAPLGNAASVALIDPENRRVDRFFLFDGGNATGSAFVDDNTVMAANFIDDYVGRFTLDQVSDQITDRVTVAPAPTSIVARDGLAYVISSNLDENFLPFGDGIVTVVDPTTMTVVGTVETGATNPQEGAFGPDGLLYVVNSEDFTSGSVAVIDPTTLQRTKLFEDIGAGPGSISVDQDGLAYISGFFLGTLVLDTGTGTFLRGSENPVCAPLAEGGCRGAFDARAGEDGTLYQVFFGSPAQGLAPQIFTYSPGLFVLTDSIAIGSGPTSIEIHSFR